MNNIRDNGLYDRVSAIEKIGVHDHLCLIYETQEEQFSAVIPFMKIGLERGEKCIYIVDDNTAAMVIEKMKDIGMDVDAAIDAGKLAIIDKQDAYLKQRYFDPDWMIDFLKRTTDEAKAAGFSALRVTGEMTWVLGGDPGTERLMEYEAKLNYFFPYNDALAICQYNRNRFSSEIIKGVISTHPLVIYGGLVCRNFYYVPPDDFLGEEQPAKEIGRLLANILNREKAEEELRQYQEHLEELVEERTAELKRMNERFSLATHAAHLGVWDWDLQTNELVWDDGVYALFGINREDFVDAYEAWKQGVHPDDQAPNVEIARLARLGKHEYDTEFRVVWPDDSIHYLKAYGLVVRDTDGRPLRMTGINFDITERKQAEDKIRNLAFYDTLTKLPNRRLLLDRFELALMASHRNKHFGAVLFLDMDKFKVLNDLLGHCSGDLMLIQVAERIRHNVREVDTAARFGGDEFVVLFEDLGHSEEEASQRVALIAEKIRAALAEPYHIKGHVHHSSPSMGVCLYCGHEISVQDLIKHADIAMYQAKSGGRNKVCFYDPISQQTVKMRAALESDLRRALSDHQLCLYYQIQFDNNGLPRGAEALIRWIHPERGIILPKQFIPIAEESSLILEIGRWVLDSACQQLAEWNKNEGTRNLLLGVNVSAHQFMMHNFVELIDEMIRVHRIDPSRLRLELTESAMMNDIPDSITKMKALNALGVKLSLDDFGTGYSSLACLKRLPFDQIKIDRSFMRDVASDPNDAMMVKAIIDMAKIFSINVIAEGVETDEQLNFLKNNGCMTFQGYLFGKPMPIEQIDIKLLH